MHLVVTDRGARAELMERGVEVGEIRHMGSDGWAPGADPEHVTTIVRDFRKPMEQLVLQEVRQASRGDHGNPSAAASVR
jgi:hypothetical protein